MKIESSARPPIVVVLGHVDHGKTSLLDAIRKSNVAAKETGGITQKIGASRVVTKDDKEITFIDTPGHAAFFNMRSRGAKLADIAILVVSADDGVMPQTKEAVKHIKESGVLTIVAITKIDLPTAQTDVALGQLEKEGLFLEKRGGDVPWLEVSAKTGKGIQELLDMISLVTEVNGIKGDAKAPLEAIVIETSKEKGGSLASVVVRNGTIRIGDVIYFEGGSCKVRSLIGEEGNLKEALPGEAVKILGFETLPQIGMKLGDCPFGGSRVEKEPSEKIEAGKEGKGILLKASNSGALEAIRASIPEKITVVEAGVGDIFESDILQAKSFGVPVFAFESKTSSHVRKLAEAEGVTIYTYGVIYELFNKLEELLKADEVQVFGKAQVIASFPFNNKKIAGCRILQGKITRVDKLVLLRKEEEIGRMKAVSIKKGKEEINEAKPGEECGILFTPQLDFTMGDVILAVSK